MRTTLDLPENLVEEAQNLLGFKSKTDTIIVALRELIRRDQLQQLKLLQGKLTVKVDLPHSRGRRRVV